MAEKIKVAVHNQAGEKIGEEELQTDIFGVAIKEGLVKQAVVAQQANARQVLAHTKDRSEVRGGGKKPWRQKGTGRARHGSIRSPLWIGGGVTFGPTKYRNFSQKINKKMKRKALLMCLSDKVSSGRLVIIDKIKLPQAKTKEMTKLINNLKLKIYNFKKNELSAKKGSTMIILPQSDLELSRAANNLPHLRTIRADSLNVIDLLKFNYLVLPQESIKKIVEVYGLKSKSK